MEYRGIPRNSAMYRETPLFGIAINSAGFNNNHSQCRALTHITHAPATLGANVLGAPQ
jgi:hypothetical protein